MQQRRSRGLGTQVIRRALCCVYIRTLLLLPLRLCTRALSGRFRFPLDTRGVGPVSSVLWERERERALLHYALTMMAVLEKNMRTVPTVSFSLGFWLEGGGGGEGKGAGGRGWQRRARRRGGRG
jgi:hypothetical protein